MMNELQRQSYLSALGLDTYMPRWQLPFAPVSVACQLPELILSDDPFSATNFNRTPSDSIAEQAFCPQAADGTRSIGVTPINSFISDFLETKKIVKTESLLKKAVEQVAEATSHQAIAAFSLSIWRPVEGLMIVDSRNTQLALPTDALLKNILRYVSRQSVPNLKEEILRCPMIENSFAKRTADDARAELQTWLSVQSEIRPINYLWLMGESAITYLLADASDKQHSLWHSSALADSSLQALLLPSLNELLINPLLKKSLLPAIHQYHS